MAFGPKYRCDPAELTFGRVNVAELARAPKITDAERQWLSPEFLDKLDDPEQLHEYLKGGETLSWAIRHQRRLAGLAIIHTASDSTPFGRALIYPEFQGKGIGERGQLLRLHHWLGVLGNEAIMSYFYDGNIRSQKLAENLGYYYVADGIHPISGKPGKAYRAVNPNKWAQFHRGNPHVNASVAARDQLTVMLDAARDIITPA